MENRQTEVDQLPKKYEFHKLRVYMKKRVFLKFFLTKHYKIGIKIKIPNKILKIIEKIGEINSPFDFCPIYEKYYTHFFDCISHNISLLQNLITQFLHILSIFHKYSFFEVFQLLFVCFPRQK